MVEIRGGAAGPKITRSQRLACCALKAFDVDVDMGGGPENENPLLTQNCLLILSGAPDEIQCLAEIRAGGLGIARGPERLHHLRPVQAKVRGKREQFEYICCPTTSPSVPGHQIAVDSDGKPPEELNIHFLHYWDRNRPPQLTTVSATERLRNGVLRSVSGKKHIRGGTELRRGHAPKSYAQ